MVQAFESGCGQAAFWASPQLVVYLNLPGLYSAYENESTPPSELVRALR
jgi:hypothetical protein